MYKGVIETNNKHCDELGELIALSSKNGVAPVSLMRDREINIQILELLCPDANFVGGRSIKAYAALETRPFNKTFDFNNLNDLYPLIVEHNISRRKTAAVGGYFMFFIYVWIYCLF